MRDHSHHTTAAAEPPERRAGGAPAAYLHHPVESAGNALEPSPAASAHPLAHAQTHAGPVPDELSVPGHASAHAGLAAHAGHGSSLGHGEHAGHSEAQFARPFWVSLLLTLPIVLYSDLPHEVFGLMAPAFAGSWLVGPVLGSVVYWYGGRVFLTGAFGELRGWRPGMMTLVALAITTAYAYSVAVTAGLTAGMAFYWELSTLVTVMLLGHWVELRAVGRARSAVDELAKLLPDTAERIAGDRIETVPAADLRPGDLVLVRPGGRVPADGLVEDGRSEVDESLLTGESRPVSKAARDGVIGGSVNGGGSLRVRVTRTGEGTMLAGIMQLVRAAQTSRTRAQALADRAAYWLTLVAVGVALLTVTGWTLARGFDDYTLERVVTTLVVACPHALGLAIPLVIAISTAVSARHGILVRDRLALERARTVDVVVFDKTGTLTRGEQGLVGVEPADGVDENRALSLAAAVEGDSEHVIARAVVAAARQRGLRLPPVEGFRALPGRGVEAAVGGRVYRVGGPRLLEREGIAVPASLAERTRVWGERGHSVVYLVGEAGVLAALALADMVRPESREAVAALKAAGLRVAMLTGDSEDAARWVAREVGIGEYVAQVLPEDKHRRLRELQSGGARVAMVGDGVNDAPALAQADVGIAIGAGADVARASAGIVLVRNDPRDVAAVITLSRASYAKMVQNLAWAIGYNAVALPLAAGVLAPFGIVLPVAVGAALMSLSTVVVAVNALTLRGLRLRSESSAVPEPSPLRPSARPGR